MIIILKVEYRRRDLTINNKSKINLTTHYSNIIKRILYYKQYFIILKLRNIKTKGYIIGEDIDFFKRRESKSSYYFIFNYT